MTLDPVPDRRPSAALANIVPLAYLVAEAIRPGPPLDLGRTLLAVLLWTVFAHAVRIGIERWPARGRGDWTVTDPARTTLAEALGGLPLP